MHSLSESIRLTTRRIEQMYLNGDSSFSPDDFPQYHQLVYGENSPLQWKAVPCPPTELPAPQRRRGNMQADEREVLVYRGDHVVAFNTSNRGRAR